MNARRCSLFRISNRGGSAEAQKEREKNGERVSPRVRCSFEKVILGDTPIYRRLKPCSRRRIGNVGEPCTHERINLVVCY